MIYSMTRAGLRKTAAFRAGLRRATLLVLAGAFLRRARAWRAQHFQPEFLGPARPAAKPDLTSPRSLRFLTDDDYPPFHFALADGSLAGFDIDLARAICDI